jgi:PP-loop superfamily ATP-utilizing enzyme
VYGAKSDLPTTGYALVADGQIKSEFNTHDPALKAARDLKGRFPKLQVKVYDAEKKLSEKIEIAAT